MKLIDDWPKLNDNKPFVQYFLSNYPRFWREKVLVYWDNFVLTNYRIYYRNQDGKTHLIPLYKVKKWEWTSNSLTLTLKDGSNVKLVGPVPTVKVLRRAFRYKDWRRLPENALPQLERNNAELGRKPIVQIVNQGSEAATIQIGNELDVYTSQPKFCPHCGEKITIEGAQFCPNCGAHLT